MSGGPPRLWLYVLGALLFPPAAFVILIGYMLRLQKWEVEERERKLREEMRRRRRHDR